MKKAISTIVAIILVCSLLVTPVFAYSGNASYGDIPKSADNIRIDGIKDDVYAHGLELELYRQWEDYGDDESETRGTAWVLWRDGFLYVFAEIRQNTLQDFDEAEGRQSGQPWEVDSLEIFLDPDNAGDNSEQYRIDAWGYRSFENRFTGDNSYGGDENTADGFFEGAAVIDGTNYNVEFRIPITRGAGDALGFLLQINDMHDFGRSMIFSGSSIDEARSWEAMTYDYIVLSADEVTGAAAVEPEADESADEGDEITFEEGDAGGPSPVETAPATNDSVMIFALLSLMAGVAAVVLRRKVNNK